MSRFFVDPSQVSGDTVTITGGDVNHIRIVLRKKPGDELTVSAGGLGALTCRITALTETCITAQIVARDAAPAPVRPVVLYQGLPKGDKMELILQKAVELGATAIVPVAMKNCVMRLTPERAENRVRRWQAIAESAAKQSGRELVPEVSMPLSFPDAVASAGGLEHRLLPYENARGMDRTRELFEACRDGGGVALFIGPEGGFDPAEVALAQQAGFAALSLGPHILRTETAGLAALSMLLYATGK